MDKKRKTEENGEDFSLPAEFFQQLNTITVDTLKTKDNKIFICKRDDKLIDVWRGLIRHKFHSVPVLLKTSDKYFGVVDLHDISRFVLQHFGKEELQSIEDFWTLAEKSDKIKNVTINDVMKSPLTRENPFKPVTTGYSLHFALELMAKEIGLHRIPIINKERKLINMLTQSRMIEFFHNNKKVLGNRINKPISLLGCATNGVTTVKETQMAIDAFNLMQTYNITAVGIVNDQGKMTGVISDTDLKLISEDGSVFYRLHRDAKAFSKQIERDTRGVVTAKVSDTFENVIDKLCDKKIHRLFVVNSENKPTGVISMKDIIEDVLVNP